MPSSGEINRLSTELREGNQQAEAQFALFACDELRRSARRHMRQERPKHALQATPLLHAAYIQSFQKRETKRENRVYHFAVPANTTRPFLVEQARVPDAVERFWRDPRISLEESPVAVSKRQGISVAVHIVGPYDWNTCIYAIKSYLSYDRQHFTN